MHSFEYILIMLGAVLISNLISQQFPKISTPLIQIGIGIALTLLPISFEITLEPELFLVLFIAPLLFEDAKKADKPTLWRLKQPILLLALGLVFATTLAVGVFIHWVAPLIPLAAAFALAAALAPTDAVAVASLKETSAIGAGREYLLKGESLLNDASGIVSFQFAIAAALTGAFSIANASSTFLFMFFGGLAVGLVLMLLRLAFVNWLHSSGIENITFHVLFEVMTPFLVFLVAEALHVSGIIAVVAAGIAYSFSLRPQTPHNARYNIVSTSVWSVLSFSLNGLVFLTLGTQLPYVIQRVWSTSAAADNFLIIIIVLILLAVLLMRFIWVLVMHRNVNLEKQEDAEVEGVAAAGVAGAAAAAGAGVAGADVASAVEQEEHIYRDEDGPNHSQTSPFDQRIPLAEDFGVMPEEERVAAVAQSISDERKRWSDLRRENRAQQKARRNAEKQNARNHPRYWALHLYDALLLSLTGAKGAITLAVVLTIPLTLNDGTPFPERDLIIFLASGVILLSLLLLNFVVPLIAPKKVEAPRPEHEVAAILDIYRSVIGRLMDEMRPEQKVATGEMAQHYYERISSLKASNQLVNKQDVEVRRIIIEWEREFTRELVSQGRVSPLAGFIYLDQLGRTLARLRHRSALGWEIKAFFEQMLSRYREARKLKRAAKGNQRRSGRVIRFEVRELTIENYLYVQERLKEYAKEPGAPTRTVELIRLEFERRVARLRNPREFFSGADGDFKGKFLEVEARALEFEREAIREALLNNKISRSTAKQLRDNVAMMELDIEEQLE